MSTRTRITPPLPQPVRTGRLAFAITLATGALFSALFSACSGGSTGSSRTTALNEGSYSVDDFGYTDEHPAGFHPLGRDGFRALEREELFAFMPLDSSQSTQTWGTEGPDASFDGIPGLASVMGADGSLRGAAAGNLDEDAEEELVGVLKRFNETDLTIRIAHRMPDGSYETEDYTTIVIQGWSVVDARVSLADIDGDFRDEIIVVARSAKFESAATYGEVWVFDDPADGATLLMNEVRSARHMNLWGLPTDVDGDGRSEIVVALEGDTTADSRFAVKLFALPENAFQMELRHGWIYLNRDTNFNHGRAVVGDFNQDGRDDLAWAGFDQSTTANLKIRLFEYTGGNDWESFADRSLISFGPTASTRATQWDIASYQPVAGQSELAVAFTASGEWNYTTLAYDGGLDSWGYSTQDLSHHDSKHSIRLQASDVDADGVEEVLVGICRPSLNSNTVYMGVIENGDAPSQTWQPSHTATPTGLNAPQIVFAPGDFDRDGLVLHHTGRRFARVADPIPLVVMGAPPTKAGISQNYDDTESGYETSTSSSESWGVTNDTTISAEAGVGFNLCGLLGVSGRVHISKSVEKSKTETNRTTLVRGYRGAYDTDVIIFQGTLLESYEYVILSAQDPSAIGSLITLDIPIDSNTYKWTVDYYNSNVAPEDRIGSDVLGHTPGQVETYPTQFELQQEMDGYVHWDSPIEVPVGIGGASDYQRVEFETEQATEEQRTISKGGGGGLSFGVSVSGDYTGSTGSTHSISYSEQTVFEAVVGDIAEPADYEDWRYTWGFSVETVGRTADANNNPTGFDGSKHSYQLLRYWVDRNGSQY